jgi:hypothetical protein
LYSYWFSSKECWVLKDMGKQQVLSSMLMRENTDVERLTSLSVEKMHFLFGCQEMVKVKGMVT